MKIVRRISAYIFIVIVAGLFFCMNASEEIVLKGRDGIPLIIDQQTAFLSDRIWNNKTRALEENETHQGRLVYSFPELSRSEIELLRLMLVEIVECYRHLNKIQKGVSISCKEIVIYEEKNKDPEKSLVFSLAASEHFNSLSRLDEHCARSIKLAMEYMIPIALKALLVNSLSLMKGSIVRSWLDLKGWVDYFSEVADHSFEKESSIKMLKKAYPLTLHMFTKIDVSLREECLSHLFGPCFNEAVPSVFCEYAHRGFADNSLAVSDDNKHLYVGLDGGKIKVFDMKKAHLDTTLNEDYSSKTSALACSSDYLFASSNQKNHITVWNTLTGEASHSLKGKTKGIKALILSQDARNLFAISNDNTIKVFDTETWKVLAVSPEFSNDITYTALSPEKQGLFIGFYDGTIGYWDSSLPSLKLISSLQHRMAVHAIAISSDGKIMISGDYSGKITVRNTEYAESWKVLQELDGHENCESSLLFSPNGNYFFSGAKGRLTKVWKRCDDGNTWQEDTLSNYRMQALFCKKLAKKNILSGKAPFDIVALFSEKYFVDSASDYKIIKAQYIKDFYNCFEEMLLS